MTETAVLQLSSFYVADGYNSSNGSARLNLGGERGIISSHTVHYISVALQELCQSRGGRPALPVPNTPNGLCGRKATLNLNLNSTNLKQNEAQSARAVSTHMLYTLYLHARQAKFIVGLCCCTCVTYFER